MKLHGPTIRARRWDLELSLYDVSSATGIDVSDLSKVERGKLPGLGPTRAKALAACLKLPIDDISPELAELKQQAERNQKLAS